MYDLTNKVAVVTGAGRRGGIGAAVARRLAQDGAHVVVGDICAFLASDQASSITGQAYNITGGRELT